MVAELPAAATTALTRVARSSEADRAAASVWEAAKPKPSPAASAMVCAAGWGRAQCDLPAWQRCGGGCGS